MVRTANQTDVEILSALCITVWVDTYSLDGLHKSHADYVLKTFSKDAMINALKRKIVYVVEVNSLIVGVLIFDESAAEIETLYVLPRFKRQGVGRSLLSHLRSHFNSSFFLTTWEGNLPAINFYEKYGFIATGETWFELDGEQHRNIVFSWIL